MPNLPSIHNPSQFDPARYEIVDYFDNKRPEYHLGMTIEAYAAVVEQWKRDLESLFPDRNAFKCQHCGQGNVRYVVCASYKGETGADDVRVCFGADCAHKLSFKNRSDLKLAQMKARAELNAQKLKVYAAFVAYTTAHPEVLELEKSLALPVHANNSFARDVLSKLRVYGYLSERQLECVKSSMARDVQFAARKAQEAATITTPAPEGRATVEGEIVSIREIPGYARYSCSTFKMLLKLDDGNKVWVTLPSASTAGKGQRIKITATFERSKDDIHFSFGKRPRLVDSPAEIAARSAEGDDLGAAAEQHADTVSFEQGRG